MQNIENMNKIVKLNVGGVVYATTEETLSDSTYLITLVRGDWDESNKDEIFIDRDHFLFRYVLLYLRTGEVDIENHHLKGLRIEADFYGLQDLCKEIDDIQEAIKEENIKLNKKKETFYHLLKEDEYYRAVSQISTVEGLGGLITRRATASNLQLITTVQYSDKEYECPRGIIVHSAPRLCGYKCRNARENFYDSQYMFAAKTITMYLVCYILTEL